MTVPRVEAVKLGIAATRHGPGLKRLSESVRSRGPGVFVDLYQGLTKEQRDAVDAEAFELAGDGVRALLLKEEGYPFRLAGLKSPPAVLFCRGNLDLLGRLGVGICGSRSASTDGLRAAKVCGDVAASMEISAISGYAKGVDTTAHVSSLRAGGATIIVMPEGIARFRVKRGEVASEWDDDRTLVVSQFSPTQPWQASAAMTRNLTIIGLSGALVVVEAGETGGTLAAGESALEEGRPVLALEFSDIPVGNRLLLERGAIAVSSRLELVELLDHLRYDENVEYSTESSDELPLDLGASGLR